MPDTTRQQSKENKLLYSILAMLKCIVSYKEFIDSSPEYDIIRELKQDLNLLPNITRRIFHTIGSSITKEDEIKWREAWNKDYMSVASIFECWAVMDEESRERLDAFADNLTNEHKFIKTIPFKEIINAAPKVGDRCLIIKKGDDKIILDTTFHNKNLGFYSVITTQYIPFNDVDLIYIL